ncbi:MAG: hypothetical protein IJE43_19545 [Alphaproteobacteria bacterium]|nr:hypothetical protein [Alphaproteobacteria bacterium]
MGRLEALRGRSRVSSEVYEQKLQRAQAAVTEYINSDISALTIANHINGNEPMSEDGLKKFTEDIVGVVTEAVLDPIAEFDDTCNARGFTATQVRNIIDAFSDIFNLAKGAEFEDKKRAVAEYLQNNPKLYDDMKDFT